MAGYKSVHFKEGFNNELGDIDRDRGYAILDIALNHYAKCDREYALRYDEEDITEGFIDNHSYTYIELSSYNWGNLVRIEWRAYGECEVESIVINAIDDADNIIVMHSADGQSFLSSFI